MNTTQWIACASVAAVVVSGLAIAAALKGVRDQLRVMIFLTCTERYSKVMNEVPFRPVSRAVVTDWPLGQRRSGSGCWEPFVSTSTCVQRRCGFTSIVESTARLGLSGSKECSKSRDSHVSWRPGRCLRLNMTIMAISNTKYFVAKEMAPCASDQSDGI